MYVLADIGGTKTRIARSEDLEQFADPIIFDTITDYEAGIGHFIEQVKILTRGETLDAICLGIPGSQSIDHRTSFISGSGTLQGWSNQNIAHDIEAKLGTRVVMENDTALVGLGEAIYGAGKGVDIVVYITVSTGVGGARIVNGSIDTVVHGSEMGGQYLVMEPQQTLEDMISGTAIQKKYGVHPKELGKATPVWEELARVLAFGLYNSLLHWSPRRVVIGGSMLNEIGISVERVTEYLKSINVKLSELPEIVHSDLGDVGGLWGGIARLKQLR